MNDKVLFEQIREITKSGWFDLETGGTGAPGNLLEELLDLKTSNLDTPDAGRWEIKFCSGKALLTLFHKTPWPRDRGRGAMRYMIKRFGWKGQNGRPSFRHTIAGKSDRGFEIAVDEKAVWVHHDEHTVHEAMVPHWPKNSLLNAVGGKLRRLIVVQGKTKGRQVEYVTATAYKEFLLTEFMTALESGLILVDFDAYLQASGAVRDHGTKFRVKPENVHKLYQDVQSI